MELEEETINNNVESIPPQSRKAHKHRHSKMVHTQLLRLSQAQDQLEAGHQSVQVLTFIYILSKEFAIA